MIKDYNYLFKILIIGDTHVGKSNLLLRYSDNAFHDSFQPTIGVDFKIKSVVYDSVPVKLQLWDTAGQERFRNITNSYYKGAHGIVIVYDITNHSSFQNVDLWLEEAEKHGAGGLVKILLGNKNDLAENRQVEATDGLHKAKQTGMGFMETSAKEGHGVEEAFEFMIKAIKEQVEKNGEKTLAGGSQITNDLKPGVKLEIKGTGIKNKCKC